MQITTELVDILRNLHDRIGKVELDSFSNEVRQVSEKFELPYQDILNLLLNEEFLKSEVYKETFEIDGEIKKLEEQLEQLKSKKRNMGSLICDFYGHTYFEKERGDDEYYCKNCGKRSYEIDSRAMQKSINYEREIYKKGERKWNTLATKEI